MSKRRRTTAKNSKPERKKAKLSDDSLAVLKEELDTLVESLPVTFEDFHCICRVCLRREDLRPFTDLEIIDTFSSLTTISIEPGDGLPDNICRQCMNHLEKTASFISTSLHSNSLLQGILDERKLELEKSEENVKEDLKSESDAVASDVESTFGDDSKFDDDDFDPADSPSSNTSERLPGHCEHCGKAYTSAKAHLKRCDAQSFRCEGCDVTFVSRFKYNAHMTMHSKSSFMCHVCSRFCLSKAVLLRHLKKHEEQNKIDIYEKGRGRPKLIEKEKLEGCLSRNLTAKQIAQHLGVSMSCVYKTCYTHGIKLLRSRYTEIEDEELEKEMEILHKQFPNSGSEMMNGHLLAKGICVQRKRVRSLLSKIDPDGTATRLGTPTNRKIVKLSINPPPMRRSYIVPAPNSLWHMDANLKLSRWGLVTHGCIDGFSRLILYLECKSSNLAKSLVPLFVQSVRVHGLPTNVQSDFGYDQSLPNLVTNALRTVNKDFVNVEKPANNQRIKKLWIDIYKQVIDIFLQDFSALEQSGQLNGNDPVHRRALHAIYVPAINSKLNLFVHAWNSHKIRTAGGKSPIQIFTAAIAEPVDVSEQLRTALDAEQLQVNVVLSQHVHEDKGDRCTDEEEGEKKEVRRILESDGDNRSKYAQLLEYLKR